MPEVDGDGRGVGLVTASRDKPEREDRGDGNGEDGVSSFHGILLCPKMDEYTESRGQRQIPISPRSNLGEMNEEKTGGDVNAV
jgi:hypothetical protein